MQNLRISNPCPMLLGRMGKKDGAFLCNSCSKEVVDFRNMSTEEIKLKLNKNTCGVFKAEQLPGQKRMSFKSSILFYTLVLLSFFGVAVKPMNAQVVQQNEKSDTVIEKKLIIGKIQISTEDKKVKRQKKKRVFFWRRKKFQPMGCPEF